MEFRRIKRILAATSKPSINRSNHGTAHNDLQKEENKVYTPRLKWMHEGDMRRRMVKGLLEKW